MLKCCWKLQLTCFFFSINKEKYNNKYNFTLFLAQPPLHSTPDADTNNVKRILVCSVQICIVLCVGVMAYPKQ